MLSEVLIFDHVSEEVNRHGHHKELIVFIVGQSLQQDPCELNGINMVFGLFKLDSNGVDQLEVHLAVDEM